MPVLLNICIASQVFRVNDITLADSWRSGFNRGAHDLEMRLPSLVQSTLDAHGLTIVSNDSGRTLIPLRGLREGDTICDVHALWYVSIAGLEEAAEWDGRAPRCSFLCLYAAAGRHNYS